MHYEESSISAFQENFTRTDKILISGAGQALGSNSEIWEVLWYSNDAQPMKKPQSFTKYLRQTLIFMWNSALRGEFNFCFSGEFY